MQARSQQFGKLDQELLGFDDADFFLQLLDVIELYVDEHMLAGARLFRQPFHGALEKLCAMKKQRRRVALQRAVHETSGFL